MKVKFKETMDLGVHHFNDGECIEINDPDDSIKELNTEYYILIYHGIRYDLHKNTVDIIDD